MLHWKNINDVVSQGGAVTDSSCKSSLVSNEDWVSCLPQNRMMDHFKHDKITPTRKKWYWVWVLQDSFEYWVWIRIENTFNSFRIYGRKYTMSLVSGMLFYINIKGLDPALESANRGCRLLLGNLVNDLSLCCSAFSSIKQIIIAPISNVLCLRLLSLHLAQRRVNLYF